MDAFGREDFSREEKCRSTGRTVVSFRTEKLDGPLLIPLDCETGARIFIEPFCRVKEEALFIPERGPLFCALVPVVSMLAFHRVTAADPTGSVLTD
jgi:hypothetical protein